MTQLTAHLFGGPVVYDQTFNLPYSDPVVQDAVLAAQLALNGLASPLGFFGPTLMNNSVDFIGSSANTVINSQSQSQIVTLEDTVGPGTIIIGNRDTGGTAFQVLAGTNNLNVNTHTLTQIFQTTTTTSTFLTSQVYDLTGVPVNGSVPEPGTVSLVAIGLGGIVLIRRRAQL